ncbi:hypothetical protein L1987_38210 [Smallanthus sonchifolius]|uniref:Uncharacterized protein n=1 Tax=Smallanthus sonchifolius TaxID=185202 RepID=A0ACB9HIJ8_9ASTR|nr:hypothetical protein L1987_38210 [Smallanthus sonchifolius]
MIRGIEDLRFETLTGDINKGLGKSHLCVGKALCHEEESVNIRESNGVCSQFQKGLIIFYSTKCDLQGFQHSKVTNRTLPVYDRKDGY